MKRVFFIESASGSLRLNEADLPLSIGGAASDINIEGVAAETVLAHIAYSSGHAYIQPTGPSVELFHNHEYIKTSAWLKSGDHLQLRDWNISWDVKGDQVFIKVGDQPEKPVLQAPTEPPPGEISEDEVEIIPVSPTPSSPGGHRKLKILFFALFGLLSLVAAFVLFATPVSIIVNPEADTQSVNGFPPPVSFGKKMLVVPGTYTLHATRKGYHPFEQGFEVRSDGFQAFAFDLDELPGRLQIVVDPLVPIRVSVNEVAQAMETGNVVLLDRGLQQLKIESDRYLTEIQALEVLGFGEFQELKLGLSPAWADAQLVSVPVGATVTVDGEFVGITPLTTEIIQGQRVIEFSLDGYKPQRFEESPIAGSSVLFGPVELEPNDGRLEVKSRPVGATVSISGTYYGSTPVSVVLASGVSHRVNLSKPGYVASTRSITVKPDEDQQLNVELLAEFGIVFASSQPADATLSLDGKAVGSGTQRLRLTARPHELTFSKPGYVSQTLRVTPRTDTSQNVDVILKTRAQAKEEARPTVLRSAGGQEMHLLNPTGSFQMGASRREAGRRANESQRLVELTRPFYLSSNEVTNAEYRLFENKHRSGSAEGVSLDSDRMPVVNVSWNAAARYCNWLSEKDKLPPAYEEVDGQMSLRATSAIGYRLPFEAEWTYAARVMSRASPVRYPWGEGYPPKTIAGNFADAQIADTLANVVTGYNDGYRGPAPVGSFSEQPVGFHDLGGNVAEWTNDFYAVYPGQATKLVKDPKGPVSGDHHVVRDSSWRDGSITELRLSYRDYSRGPRDDLGFRIARYADE